MMKLYLVKVSEEISDGSFDKEIICIASSKESYEKAINEYIEEHSCGDEVIITRRKYDMKLEFSNKQEAYIWISEMILDKVYI